MSKRTAACDKPDRDVPGLKCGYPLPCPHHTIVVDTSRESVTLTVPKAVKYPNKIVRARLLEVGEAVKRGR